MGKKDWHFPPSERSKERLGERNKEIFNNKYWIRALKTSFSLMEGQFGDKPKPPSCLWHMIKICFVLLICYSQITTLLLALQTQTSRLPLNYCTTFPPFFSFNQHWTKKVPSTPGGETMSPNVETKCVIQGALPPTAMILQQKYISLEVWEHKRWTYPWQGSRWYEVFFPPLTPEILLLFHLSLQNKESLTRM